MTNITVEFSGRVSENQAWIGVYLGAVIQLLRSPVPKSPSGLCGGKTTLKSATKCTAEFRGRVLEPKLLQSLEEECEDQNYCRVYRSVRTKITAEFRGRVSERETWSVLQSLPSPVPNCPYGLCAGRKATLKSVTKNYYGRVWRKSVGKHDFDRSAMRSCNSVPSFRAWVPEWHITGRARFSDVAKDNS